MWNGNSLPVGADGFAGREHSRPRVPLPRAKVRFFLRAPRKKHKVYYRALKPSTLYKFSCPYSGDYGIFRKGPLYKKIRAYYGALKPSSLYKFTLI